MDNEFKNNPHLPDRGPDDVLSGNKVNYFAVWLKDNKIEYIFPITELAKEGWAMIYTKIHPSVFEDYNKKMRPTLLMLILNVAAWDSAVKQGQDIEEIKDMFMKSIGELDDWR